MSNPTPAQEEFADLLAKNSTDDGDHIHPEDRADAAEESRLRAHDDDDDDEDRYRASQIDAAMRAPTGPGSGVRLPPASFDSGRATGVKGVIADARSYEQARKSKWTSRVRTARRSIFGIDGLMGSGHARGASRSESERSAADDDDDDDDDDDIEESFIREWRESRRRELEEETRGGPGVHNRRTSPSVRLFGRLDEVDAMGYLDAIEKVAREVTVVVFVYDHESDVSSVVESALAPLVGMYPAVHFVKVHCDDVEFDSAAVPAVLAYRNQGDLFANLTALIDMIPEDEDFDSGSLQRIFQKHGIL